MSPTSILTSPQLTVQDSQLAAKWDGYLQDYARDALQDLALAWPESKSFTLSFRDVELRDPELANLLLAKPHRALLTGRDVVHGMMRDLVPDPSNPALIPKPQLRVSGLPASSHFGPRQLQAHHLGALVAVKGILTACSGVLFDAEEITWECKVCTTQVRVPQEDDTVTEPVFCETCDAQRPWRKVASESRHVNYQILRIQEMPETLEGGQTPQSLTVRLYDDLVQRNMPGARLIVTGILDLKYRRAGNRLATDAEPVLEAVHVEQDLSESVNLESTPDELARFQAFAAQPDVHRQLARCIRPSILGLDDVKLSLLYAMIGAPTTRHADGRTTRGRIHVLVAGDPGIAKTQLVAGLPAYVPRCIQVFGLNTNKVGLGVGIIKDDATGQWMLQPGALVLAHRAMLVIDEFGLIDPEDRPAVHSGMEEGKVDYNKILQGSSPAEMTLVATTNPGLAHRFDPYSPLIEQLGMTPALLSRFDLVWCLRDIVNREKDRELARRQLGAQAAGSVQERYGVAWTADEVRRFIHQARRLEPTMGAEAMQLLEDYYQRVRESDKDNPPFTPRQLDALKRLSMASARIRWSLTVDAADAQRAIQLMGLSLKSCNVMDDTGHIDGNLLQFGTSKSQADRVRLVLQLVKDQTRSHPDGLHRGFAREADLVAAGLLIDISDDMMRKTLETLRQNGTIYERGGRGCYAVLST